MKTARSMRTIAVLASAALISTGMIAGTADAKKKKKPTVPPPPPACAEYVPGELGTGAPTTKVTPAATADAPVEVTIATDPGFGTGTGLGPVDDVTMSQISHALHNVQVDSEGATTLFVRLEMPETTDYDLYVRAADGTAVASASGFNPEPAIYNDTSNGGHTEVGAEVIDGVATEDCGGYTIEMAGATTPGGDVTLKLWLE
jgi:hypothetical protein